MCDRHRPVIIEEAFGSCQLPGGPGGVEGARLAVGVAVGLEVGELDEGGGRVGEGAALQDAHEAQAVQVEVGAVAGDEAEEEEEGGALGDLVGERGEAEGAVGVAHARPGGLRLEGERQGDAHDEDEAREHGVGLWRQQGE